jgi:hypothetical protein
MDGRKNLVVASTIAAYEMTAVAPPAEAPRLDPRDPVYMLDHKIVPSPVKGTRGEATVLRLPAKT